MKINTKKSQLVERFLIHFIVLSENLVDVHRGQETGEVTGGLFMKLLPQTTDIIEVSEFND